MRELDELRDYINRNAEAIHPKGVYYMSQYMDAIEQSVADRYMELPVDAEGVPIHVGDSMVPWNGEGVTVVAAVCEDGFADENVPMHYAPNMHHVKPETVEDVLADLVEEWGAWNGCDAKEEAQMFRRYAERIREVLDE